MNQQKMEQALRDVATLLKNCGSTTTHDVHADRKRANDTLAAIAAAVNGTLADIDAGRKASK